MRAVHPAQCPLRQKQTTPTPAFLAHPQLPVPLTRSTFYTPGASSAQATPHPAHLPVPLLRLQLRHSSLPRANLRTEGACYRGVSKRGVRVEGGRAAGPRPTSQCRPSCESCPALHSLRGTQLQNLACCCLDRSRPVPPQLPPQTAAPGLPNPFPNLAPLHPSSVNSATPCAGPGPRELHDPLPSTSSHRVS